MYSAAGGLASPTYFFTIQSLVILTVAVIGGINSWIGAFIGATLYLLFSHVFDLPLVQNSYIAKHIFHGQLSNPGFLPMLFGLGAIGLAQNPNGIVEQIREGWGGFVDLVRRAGSLFGRREAAVDTEAAEATEATDAAATDSAPTDSAPTEAIGSGGTVVFPQGRLYHRPDCVLSVGKDGGSAVSGDGRELQPCPVCEPEPVSTS